MGVIGAIVVNQNTPCRYAKDCIRNVPETSTNLGIVRIFVNTYLASVFSGKAYYVTSRFLKTTCVFIW